MNYKVTIARGASGSPSSRRAWIEMTKPFLHKQSFYVVALLAEGVDRNNPTLKIEGLLLKSPSSRRAWIEISVRQDVQGRPVRRPPRGGRG